jgi:hypothetical protein
MPRYSCPSCGAKTFTYWAKQFIGPMRRVRCSSCNSLVSVGPGLSSAVLLLGPLVAFAGGAVGAVALIEFGILAAGTGFVAGGLIASVPSCWVWHRYVPLVRKDA